MYTYGPLAPDPSLVAMGVVIWVAAIGVAFCVYLPCLRTGREAFWARRMVRGPAEVENSPDRAARPHRVTAYRDPGVARPPAAAAAPPAAPRAGALAGPPEPVRTPDRFSVLIVDDNAINRQVLELILDSAGMAHVSVENGLQAVEAMRDTAYDAILMDLQMPVMDGFEATRRIRDMEARRASHSTIIVVSANCLDEHVAAGRDAGADAHLAKPVSAGALIGELASCPALNRMAA